MILEIVQYGHPVLRERCAEVGEVTREVEELARDMIETMHDAHGVGLAAPQVGVAIRLAVVDVSHDPECIGFLKVNGEDAELKSIMPLVFINPELEFTGEREKDREGCLSIGDVVRVARARLVRFATDEFVETWEHTGYMTAGINVIEVLNEEDFEV